MAKKSTPSFVLELELYVNQQERSELYKKLNIARQIYNACLGETLKRLHKIQNDKNYALLLQEWKAVSQKLVTLKKKEEPPKTKIHALEKRKAELRESLKAIELQHGYSEYLMHDWAKGCGKHFHGNIGSLEVQKLATRAFRSVEKVHYHEADHVNFKPKGELISIENKSNHSGLRWKNNKVLFGNLKMDVNLRKNDVYAKEALMNKVKYLRIVPKVIRGKTRFFVQFVLEGYPPVKKHRVIGPINERVGIDPGITTMAISSKYCVCLEELAPSAEIDERKIRVIQRAMDRSRRATNQENYHSDGTIKKGKKTWNYSNRYLKLASKRKELYRRVAAKRKLSHEILANKILSIGLDVRVEDMQYKALQKRATNTTKNQKNGKINKKKRFGKSLSNRAPAMFLDILDRKLHYYGQKLKKIDTRELKASQFNHLTGEYVKKELSERWNLLNDKKVQRDLYSAFLIENTNDDFETVDIELANKRYDDFLKLHDAEIVNIKHTGSKTLQWYVA